MIVVGALLIWMRHQLFETFPGHTFRFIYSNKNVENYFLTVFMKKPIFLKKMAPRFLDLGFETTGKNFRGSTNLNDLEWVAMCAARFGRMAQVRGAIVP